MQARTLGPARSPFDKAAWLFEAHPFEIGWKHPAPEDKLDKLRHFESAVVVDVSFPSGKVCCEADRQFAVRFHSESQRHLRSLGRNARPKDGCPCGHRLTELRR